MKKFIYTIGFLMFFSVLVHPLAARGQGQEFSGDEKDVPFSTARIFSSLLEKTGLTPNGDWGTAIGPDDSADVGQNLYLTIYEKTQDAPEKTAFKNTAGKYGITEAEMVLLSQNNYGPILKKKPTLTQAEAYNKMSEMQQSLLEEKSMMTLQADIKAEVEMSEIFANGDLGDSGFDLIYDLQNIEKILFLKSDPIDVGKAWDGGGNGAAIQLPVPPGPGNQQGGGNNGPGGLNAPGGNGNNNQPIQKNNGVGPNGLGANNGGNPAGPGANKAIDPNACFKSSAFDDAFKKFTGKAQLDPNYKDLSANSGSPNLAGNANGGGNNNNPGQNVGPAAPQLVNNDFMPEKVPPPAPPVLPAPASDWVKPKDCDKIFCLKVEMILKPVTSAFKNSDNCIACHVEKINDTLKKVLTHSLVPSKAPGNLFESSKCKKSSSDAFGAISMNFYAITMPVKTPTNDDLVFGTNAADDWQNFCKTVAFFPFDSCKKEALNVKTVEESKYEIPPVLQDVVSKTELSKAPDDVSQAEITRNINIAVQAYQVSSAKETAALEASKEADLKIVMFHPLLTEMDTMNSYFLSFSQILQSLHKKIDSIPGGQACTELKDKETCE